MWVIKSHRLYYCLVNLCSPCWDWMAIWHLLSLIQGLPPLVSLSRLESLIALLNHVQFALFHKSRRQYQLKLKSLVVHLDRAKSQVSQQEAALLARHCSRLKASKIVDSKCNQHCRKMMLGSNTQTRAVKVDRDSKNPNTRSQYWNLKSVWSGLKVWRLASWSRKYVKTSVKSAGRSESL